MSGVTAKRIYAYPADPEKGERDGRGCRAFTVQGHKIPFVQRIELDDDSDEGMATLQAIYCLPDGSPAVDPDKGEVCKVTIRTWVRVVHQGQPNPMPTPHELLWRAADGRIVPGADPVPSVPFSHTQEV